MYLKALKKRYKETNINTQYTYTEKEKKRYGARDFSKGRNDSMY